LSTLLLLLSLSYHKVINIQPTCTVDSVVITVVVVIVVVVAAAVVAVVAVVVVVAGAAVVVSSTVTVVAVVVAAASVVVSSAVAVVRRRRRRRRPSRCRLLSSSRMAWRSLRYCSSSSNVTFAPFWQHARDTSSQFNHAAA